METVMVNRAPVLTLWASVVAHRLGFREDEALTLGKAVAGLTAQSKGQRLGIFTPSPESVRTERAKKAKAAGVFRVALLGRAVPVLQTEEGLRAVGKDQKPVNPESVQRYLAAKFGKSLEAARAAMEELAKTLPRETLARVAFHLYEDFRPVVPPGERGWGTKGKLELKKIRGATAAGTD